METWVKFLNSLRVPGAAVAILLGLTLVCGTGAVIGMVKYGPTAPAVTLIAGTFGSAFSALLLGLNGGQHAPTSLPDPKIDPSTPDAPKEIK